MMKRQMGLLLLLATLAILFLPAGVTSGEWRLETARQLEQRLQPFMVAESLACPDQGFDLQTNLIRFYRLRQFEPAWVDRYGLLPEGAMALAMLKQAGRQGLFDTDYHSPWLNDLLDGMITRPVIIGAAFDGKQVQLDLTITGMVLRYAYHHSRGHTEPRMIGREGPGELNPTSDLAVALVEALGRGRLEAFFEQLEPRHKAYRALRHSLPRYQRIQAAGGWGVIDEGHALTKGDCGPRVAQLRHRLILSGDIRMTSEGTADCFGGNLAAAVSSFQQRHGLSADGVAGPRTLAALNIPVAQRIRQIQLSLERWRWLPHDLGSRYVLVNIPAFQMQVVEEGRVIKTMRTIVGQQDRPTPALASVMTYLEINPYWHVPAKIAREDLLPKIQANPSYLTRQKIRVFESWAESARELDPRAIDWSSLSADYFPFRLRQEPAGRNALGRVKFMFPNEVSVYIHDTPSKGLFRKPSRPFSSGCVRVEEPLALVSLLLNRQGWDQERLAAAVASNERQIVILDEPVPVYLVYMTAWAAAPGEIHFQEDIYGHDQTLAGSLARRSVLPKACRQTLGLPTYLGGAFGKDQAL